MGKLSQEGDESVKETFECLLKGEVIRCPIDEQIVYSQLDDDVDAIWSLLLASGYLKVIKYEELNEVEDEPLELCQYLGHKKLNFSPSIAYAERIIFMLSEPHLQPVVVSCNQEHYGAFFGCRMTLYIQRVLI